ncbi:MAG: FISUMP domain-containing protein [Prolixibacteraceae bacterium]|jgi:uncharacterized protein (TIGR02145 family)|nr:FISUMP domain-containing protein [Prolixibacteraceae bacterium]
MKKSNLLSLSALIVLLISMISCTDEPPTINEAPTCEITNPSEGSEIEQGEVVTITVDAKDSDGSITEVKFYVDGFDVGLATDFPYNFEWDTKNISIGTHTIRAKAKDDNGNLSKDEVEVEVGEIVNGQFTDFRDGHKYKAVEIGTQIWMAENLAWLPKVSPPSSGSYSTPYYYVYGYNGSNVTNAKAERYYETYGVLYNWTAASNACPDNWHLPTDEEWKQLEMYIGMSQSDADATGYRGTEGEKLKATSGWNSNGNGTDEYGFSALPGGLRFDNHYVGYPGRVNGVHDKGYWWSATMNESDNSTAWYRRLTDDESGVRRSDFNRDGGHSVRCVRD